MFCTNVEGIIDGKVIIKSDIVKTPFLIQFFHPWFQSFKFVFCVFVFKCFYPIILFQAEQLIDEFNFELAQKFCQRALETEPDNVRALETSASLLLELGNCESAKHVSIRLTYFLISRGVAKKLL